jgi:hypothetical protein
MPQKQKLKRVSFCLEGFRLAAQWSQGQATIETDSARIVQLMEEVEGPFCDQLHYG